MPNKKRKSRSRSRNHNLHSKARDSRHRRRSPTSQRESRLRSLSPSTSNKTITETMQQILNRLMTLEERQRVAPSQQRQQTDCGSVATAAEPVAPTGTGPATVSGSTTPPLPSRPTTAEPTSASRGRPGRPGSAAQSSPERLISAAVEHPGAADRIIEAIRSLNMPAQVAGKLDAGMRGPYRVVKALPHGRYELQLLAGSYGKTTQAAAEYMVPWRGEWTPETCSVFFEDADCNEDNAESTHERTTPGSSVAVMPEAVPTTSCTTGSHQPCISEAENVLQSGEAVLTEETLQTSGGEATSI